VVVTEARLSWIAPTEYTDGTALSDLAGYRVHMGTAPRAYDTVFEISDPAQLDYVVDALERGRTYYFAVTAVNTAGDESGFSNEGSKAIP
jgi:hypothetical protein